MTASPNIPTALRVVAYLQLAMGVFSAMKMLILLMNGAISVEFGILGIPIYFGLLNLRNGWRLCAMVLQWFGLLGLPLIALLGLVASVPAYFGVFGINIARMPGWVASAGTVPLILLVLWQYRVLTRSEIRWLFREAG